MVAGLVLALLVLAAGFAPHFGRAGSVGLVAVSVLWFMVNDPLEGRTLLPVTPDHGLTTGDLAGLAGLAVAGWVWSRRARPPH